MRRILAASIAFAVAGSALAAVPPVTRREFSIIVGEVESAINRGLQLGIPARKPVTDKSPMPRSEIISEFVKIFEASRPKFVMTPRPSRYDEELIKKHNKGESVTYLTKLCRWGMVSPAGPMVIAPEAGLTPLELGDALGTLILQISVLTHHPSPIWSPSMMKGG